MLENITNLLGLGPPSNFPNPKQWCVLVIINRVTWNRYKLNYILIIHTKKNTYINRNFTNFATKFWSLAESRRSVRSDYVSNTSIGWCRIYSLLVSESKHWRQNMRRGLPLSWHLCFRYQKAIFLSILVSHSKRHVDMHFTN